VERNTVKNAQIPNTDAASAWDSSSMFVSGLPANSAGKAGEMDESVKAKVEKMIDRGM